MKELVYQATGDELLRCIMQCRSYTKQSWQPTGSNTCCF